LSAVPRQPGTNLRVQALPRTGRRLRSKNTLVPETSRRCAAVKTTPTCSIVEGNAFGFDERELVAADGFLGVGSSRRTASGSSFLEICRRPGPCCGRNTGAGGGVVGYGN